MTLIVAHRGASKAHPENTLEAFRAAGEMGADWVELDVRVTADGAVVVHHDNDLADGRLLSELSVAELPEHVSLLDDIVVACEGMGVNIEIKNEPDEVDFDPEHRMVPEVVRVARTRLAKDKVLITSFDMGAINAVHDEDRTMPTGFLTMDTVGPEVSVGRASAHGHVAINPWDDVVTQRWVDEAHAAGLLLNVWTVDEPSRMRQLRDMGVDGIITNVPDVAVKALR